MFFFTLSKKLSTSAVKIAFYQTSETFGQFFFECCYFRTLRKFVLADIVRVAFKVLRRAFGLILLWHFAKFLSTFQSLR